MCVKIVFWISDMHLAFRTKFQGDQAEQHRIPAFEGSESLLGVSRSVLLIGHYVDTDQIRKKAPFSENVKFYIQPFEKGSLEAVFTLIIENKELVQLAGGSIAFGITANFFTDLIKAVFSRATGQPDKVKNDHVNEIKENRPGDYDALTDAVENPLRQAHRTIGEGANQIILIEGNNNIVNFNEKTKEYISRSVELDEEEIIEVSIGSLNVNTGYGRAFFHDLGKTVPFNISSGCEPGTKEVLSYSLNQYAKSAPSNVSIIFRRITDVNGRTKKVIIYSAKLP